MAQTSGAPSNRGMIVQTVQVETRLYENRMQLCHKKNCSVCYGPGRSREIPPGHGPYWYLILRKGDKRIRLYIGKTLDTRRFIKPDGEIDWQLIKERRVAWKNRGSKKLEVKER